MKGQIVSTVEGKKNFGRLIDDATKSREEIVITRRGKPVAVIVAYDAYVRSRRKNAWQAIMKAREAFRKAGIRGEGVPEEARKELEARS